MLDPQKLRRIADDRMAAIEDADLHRLEVMHARREDDADLFEGGTTGREAVFDHPLAERLARHRPRILAKAGRRRHRPLHRAVNPEERRVGTDARMDVNHRMSPLA